MDNISNTNQGNNIFISNENKRAMIPKYKNPFSNNTGSISSGNVSSNDEIYNQPHKKDDNSGKSILIPNHQKTCWSVDLKS